MKIKKEIIENFMKSKQLLENKSKNGSDLIIGTAEYTEFLEKIISDLRAVKGSLKTRSRIGKENIVMTRRSSKIICLSRKLNSAFWLREKAIKAKKVDIK